MKKKLPSPKTLQRLWLKALESGRYKQTTGALQKGNEYCCLGVACRIYKRFAPLKTDVTSWGQTEFDGKDGILPAKVRKALGLRTQAKCVRMNDEDNLSFKQIAAAIRKDRKKFFRS